MTLMIKCMQHRELIYPEKNDSPILKSKSDKNETVLALDKCRPTLVFAHPFIRNEENILQIGPP